MESKTEIQKIITLILNESEANWLKGHMQNPLNDEHPDNEPIEDQEMRRIFWDALNHNR